MGFGVAGCFNRRGGTSCIDVLQAVYMLLRVSRYITGGPFGVMGGGMYYTDDIDLEGIFTMFCG